MLYQAAAADVLFMPNDRESALQQVGQGPHFSNIPHSVVNHKTTATQVYLHQAVLCVVVLVDSDSLHFKSNCV